MDRLETWLLEAAVEDEVPLWYLNDPVRLLNVPHHRADHQELAAKLLELHAFGLIEWWVAPRNVEFADVLEALRRSEGAGLAYALTSAGGGIWADQARPDWTRLVRSVWGDPGDEHRNAFVEGVSVDRIRAMAKWLEEDGCDITEEAWEEVAPFRPVYWTEVARGFRFSYRSRWHNPPPYRPDDPASVRHGEQLGDLGRWYTSLIRSA